MRDNAASETTSALPNGTVTFLLTDVAGSTRLWEAGEDGAAAAIARHYELLGAAISLHGGVQPVEQGEGDSVVAVFAKPSDAVATAVEVQRAIAAEPWPVDDAFRVRIAVHSGEARVRDEGNYFGPAVIRCARLRAIAHGGQTLLSESARDLVVDSLPDGVTLRSLGSHRLKDLGRAERVWQLCHADLDAEFPALLSLDAFPNNLPPQLTSFVGREAELSELHDVMSKDRLVTLTGSGGCGKTRLALQLAADVADRFGGGTWWVDLAPLSDADLVPNALARVLGLREEPDRPLVDTLSEQLAGVDALVVLDNCEHVVDATVRLVEELLVSVPGLRVMATSREPLGIPGELVWRVPSLRVDAAASLFVERATQVRPGFTPDATEVEAISEICTRLDGLPLAIELAAARTRMMGPVRIAQALGDRFRLLTGAGRTAMPRQQTLEASMAWSHDLLDEQERVLLRRLSVLHGGFTIEAAEAVGADELVDRYAVLDLVGRLLDKSLVQFDPGEAAGRYRLLETVRLYAGARLADAGETDATRHRHLAFFLELAEQAEPEIAGPDGPGRLARLEQEHDNFRSALEWADISGADESLLRLVTALTLFYELRGHLGEGGRWFARALARDDGPSAVRARALWGAAHVAVYGDDFATATRRAPEALHMAQVIGDERAMARALNTVGYLQLFSEPEPARAALDQSVALGRRSGDNWAVLDSLKMLTVAWMTQDEYEGLGRALEELLHFARHLDNRFFIAWCHCCAGWMDLRRGNFEASRRALETSVEYCREVGEPATEGIAVALLAEVEAWTGRHDEAEARLGEFVQRAAATGRALGVPLAVVVLARLALGRGEPDDARALLTPLVEQLRSVGAPGYLSSALTVLGPVLVATGEEDAAGEALREAHDLAAAIANPWLVASATYHLAELDRHRGDHDRAEDLHHKALALRAAGGLLPGVIESLEALAGLAAQQESYAEAARAIGAATALRRLVGMPRWPADRAAHDDRLSRLRDALGDAAFDRARSEGEALGVDDAVAYVSRARGERKRPSAGWASLTPTELEVVKLAAGGLTNPQIGERLFIGRGTVKSHLAHVFTKLGVATRAELAAEAARRGL